MVRHIKIMGQELVVTTERLGQVGGFGAVFLGYDANGHEVAVKRLFGDLDSGAHRELQMADVLIGRTFDNVLPILAAGEDQVNGGYYVIMPRAEKSLEDELAAVPIVSSPTAREILLQIARGLRELPAEIIHRDLKPANILRHLRVWKISDFGIARNLGLPTSSRTLKDDRTEEYAAPEQFVGEAVTRETDIYALGCIGYRLLTGSPPFHTKPGRELGVQHRFESPPSLLGPNIEPWAATVLPLMLEKHPGSRLQLDSIIERLVREPAGRVSTPEGAGRLVAMEAEVRAREHVRMMLERERRNVRYSGLRILSDVAGAFVKTFRDHLPSVGVDHERHRLVIHARGARVELDFPEESEIPVTLSRTYARDLVLVASLRLVQNTPWKVWEENLFFSREAGERSYHWYAVLIVDRQGGDRPYASLDPAQLVRVLTQDDHRYAKVFGPRMIDPLFPEDFAADWLEPFVRAGNGMLPRIWRAPTVGRRSG